MKWAIVASQHRSLRQAAETLNVRQSTLSRRLRDIELQLGAELFERTNGGTRATAAGLEFLEASRRILEESEATFRRLKSRGRGESGRLTVGVYASPSIGNMHAAMVEHHQRFPNVDLQIVDGSHEKLLRSLVGSVIDIAVMTTCRSGWDDRLLPLWSERVIVAIPQGHPLNERPIIRWPDLSNERIALPQYGPGPELERLLTAKLDEDGSQRISHHASGLDRLLSLVSAEYGLLLMLEGGTGVHYDGVVYREIHEDTGPTRLNFAAYWRAENGNPTLTSFLSMLHERYPDLSLVARAG